MKKNVLLFILLLFSSLNAQEYKLGRGYQVMDGINIGGYFSLDYSKGDSVDLARLDDLAFLAYGNLPSNFSYFVELEGAPFYQDDFKNDIKTLNTTFNFERLYLNYFFSEMFNFRLGKQITPIGYWNLEPINVLRDTSSNPLYSNKIFPKFVTGVDTSGYIDEDHASKYHFFLQITDDLDKDYINLRNDFFIGLSIENETEFDLSYGAAVGYYETKDEDMYLDDNHVTLVEINAKYDIYPMVIQTEWAYSNIDYSKLNTQNYKFGGYLQSMYNFNMQHALIARYEYFRDSDIQNNIIINDTNNIAVLGYSYRPIYPVSLKIEYQINSNSYLNKAIASFSVLF